MIDLVVEPKREVLDHGFVQIDDWMATDLSVVNSARVSFGKRHEEMEEGDIFLINYLMKHHHGTPFEHNSMRFIVKAPIFVFREWHRHRIASINEMSARYTELPADWYIPEIENVRARVEGSKPGEYRYIPLQNIDLDSAELFIKILNQQCEASYNFYKTSLDKKVAPEQARMFLHVNHYSEMYWTINARSLMNFLALRNSFTAQWEIMKYAQVIEDMWSQLMPITHQCFVNCGRVAP